MSKLTDARAKLRIALEESKEPIKGIPLYQPCLENVAAALVGAMQDLADATAQLEDRLNALPISKGNGPSGSTDR